MPPRLRRARRLASAARRVTELSSGICLLPHIHRRYADCSGIIMTVFASRALFSPRAPWKLGCCPLGKRFGVRHTFDKSRDQ